MDIRQEIKKLSDAEKILLVEEIWDSLETENKSFLSEEKKMFLDERLEAIQKGEATFVSLDEIKSRFNSLK
ncbi:MAG TPA: addiction module protein [Chitinophagales bacterium]|nr:addiction module protein [Chitinophagales bacterium]